ncbi:MAG: hypothetical protein ACK5LK_10095 [Chthoniobacterales bacterium]
MKKSLRLLAFALLALPLTSQAQAQEEFVAPQQEQQPTLPDLEKPEGLTVEGIVAEVFKRPLQATKIANQVNPFAPASYGSGEKNVSEDTKAPHGNSSGYHEAAGYVLLSLEW